MGRRLIECVPNFSEGRDMEIIRGITDEIRKIDGVSILGTEPGEAANRTVVTFAGEPEAVVEAAFLAVRKAAELIDMSRHHGTHPRMGATDVLPLVPISGITVEECALLARGLARRIAEELGIPCYCYEAAAFKAERRNLAVCRAGEYEGLKERMGSEENGPDFGNRAFDRTVKRSGAIAVGARDFLIAVNFNLDTSSVRSANAIAFDVREKGRVLREGGSADGKVLTDAEGRPLMKPGTLKGVKALGWYIDEYGIAQVSMNITDIYATPLYRAFDEVSRAAAERGVRVSGTEIIGLIPLKTILDAGKHYIEAGKEREYSEKELIQAAVEAMGLDELRPFIPEEKIIEYRTGL